MFTNFISSFLGGLQGSSSKPFVASEEDKPKINKEQKYETKIQALTEYFAERLKSGVCEIEFSQLSQIIPKNETG